MSTTTIKAYRKLLREVYKSAAAPNLRARNSAFFRQAVLTKQDPHLQLENAATFLRSDRIYKELLERYSPLKNLTEEERIRATARRVGLDVPKQRGES